MGYWVKGVLLGDYIIVCPRQRDKSMGLSEQPHRETTDERLTSVLLPIRSGTSVLISDTTTNPRLRRNEWMDRWFYLLLSSGPREHSSLHLRTLLG